MEILQIYHDVPPIEHAPEDYTAESFAAYGPPAELNQYWRSIDPGLNAWRPIDAHPANNSAHLANMEKHLLHLTNSAYGCGPAPAMDLMKQESPRIGLSTRWGPGGEALRTMRYMSPNGPMGGSLSSTNSTPSDYAFSPDVSRHHASFFRDDLDSQMSYGSPYPVPFSPAQYNYPSQCSYSGRLVASPTPMEQTIACNMKELQYTADPENEDVTDESDCIKIETDRPKKMAPTPESCCLAIDTPSRSEYDESMKDEDEDNGVDSDVDPEYSPSRLRPTRRISNNRHPRSPTLPRIPVRPSAFQNNSKISKPSQRAPAPTKNKTKNVPRRRFSNKNGDNTRPFVCSFSHYGCESRFSSKNEWKRHVSSQHLQLGFYRCDVHPCNPDSDHSFLGSGNSRSYNDFNRKDLFTQHHRRMHTPWTPANKPPSKQASEKFEEGLEAVRQRCWRERRQAPKRSQCIFCEKRFDGEMAWEERMEHIGKHFESAEREKKDRGEGDEDLELRAWALEQGIVVDCGPRGYWLAGLQDERDSRKAVPVTRAKRGKNFEGGDEDAIGDDE